MDEQKPVEYSPEEIRAAQQDEGSQTQNALTDYLQNRTWALNIEVRRAQARIKSLEQNLEEALRENEALRAEKG